MMAAGSTPPASALSTPPQAGRRPLGLRLQPHCRRPSQTAPARHPRSGRRLNGLFLLSRAPDATGLKTIDFRSAPIAVVAPNGQRHRLNPSSPTPSASRERLTPQSKFTHPRGRGENGYFLPLLVMCAVGAHFIILAGLVLSVA